MNHDFTTYVAITHSLNSTSALRVDEVDKDHQQWFVNIFCTLTNKMLVEIVKIYCHRSIVVLDLFVNPPFSQNLRSMLHVS